MKFSAGPRAGLLLNGNQLGIRRRVGDERENSRVPSPSGTRLTTSWTVWLFSGARQGRGLYPARAGFQCVKPARCGHYSASSLVTRSSSSPRASV
jgi:hypothetical protein